MSTVPTAALQADPNGYAQRVTRNDAVIAQYREEMAERRARGASTRSSERVIDRLEVETTLLRAWAERDARAQPPAVRPVLTTEGTR
jgi:hypothetical protein